MSQNQFYKYTISILKQLNIPFEDPCDVDYVGDCSVCEGESSVINTDNTLLGDGSLVTPLRNAWNSPISNPGSGVIDSSHFTFLYDTPGSFSFFPIDSNNMNHGDVKTFCVEEGAGMFISDLAGRLIDGVNPYTHINGCITLQLDTIKGLWRVISRSATGGTYTPPTYTEGSVLFADNLGLPTEDNDNFFFDTASDSLLVGTNNPSQLSAPWSAGSGTTEASFVSVSNLSSYKPSLLLAMSGEGGMNSFFSIGKGSGGGVDQRIITNNENGFNVNSLAEDVWSVASANLSQYTCFGQTAQGTTNRSLLVTERPIWGLFSGQNSGSSDVDKVIAVLGINYVTTNNRSSHNGGTYIMFPNYNNSLNNYVDQVPDNIAYFNDFGVLSRSTPNQLQVTNPTTATVTDLSVALSDLNSGGTDGNGMFDASNDNGTWVANNITSAPSTRVKNNAGSFTFEEISSTKYDITILNEATGLVSQTSIRNAGIKSGITIKNSEDGNQLTLANSGSGTYIEGIGGADFFIDAGLEMNLTGAFGLNLSGNDQFIKLKTPAINATTAIAGQVATLSNVDGTTEFQNKEIDITITSTNSIETITGPVGGLTMVNQPIKTVILHEGNIAGSTTISIPFPADIETGGAGFAPMYWHAKGSMRQGAASVVGVASSLLGNDGQFKIWVEGGVTPEFRVQNLDAGSGFAFIILEYLSN